MDQKGFIKLAGGGLLRIYDNSLFDLLRTAYPDYDWLPWRFNTIPNMTVRNPEALVKVMRFLEFELRIKNPEDWYAVSKVKLDQLGVLNLIRQLGGLFTCLKEYKNDFEWEEEKFFGAK